MSPPWRERSVVFERRIVHRSSLGWFLVRSCEANAPAAAVAACAARRVRFRLDLGAVLTCMARPEGARADRWAPGRAPIVTGGRSPGITRVLGPRRRSPVRRPAARQIRSRTCSSSSRPARASRIPARPRYPATRPRSDRSTTGSATDARAQHPRQRVVNGLLGRGHARVARARVEHRSLASARGQRAHEIAARHDAGEAALRVDHDRPLAGPRAASRPSTPRPRSEATVMSEGTTGGSASITSRDAFERERVDRVLAEMW